MYTFVRDKTYDKTGMVKKIMDNFVIVEFIHIGYVTYDTVAFKKFCNIL